MRGLQITTEALAEALASLAHELAGYAHSQARGCNLNLPQHARSSQLAIAPCGSVHVGQQVSDQHLAGLLILIVLEHSQLLQCEGGTKAKARLNRRLPSAWP